MSSLERKEVNDMDEKVKLILSGLLGTLAALSENYGAILLLCCAFILIDLATGLAKARIQGRINSTIGYKGFWRKAALLATLVFGICLDLLAAYVAGPGITAPIGRILGLYIAINECISISENLAACGVKLPRFITTALDSAQKDLSNQEH